MDVLFIIGDWNVKVRSQEIPGVTGKFGLGVQNEAGKRLTDFCQDNALVIVNTLSNNTREVSTHGHHQMVKGKRYTVSKNKAGRLLWLRS